MKFSVVIPAHNEEGVIASTLERLLGKLNAGGFDFEIVVVADHCTDGTQQILDALAGRDKRVRWVENKEKPGFGMAVRTGLEEYKGDAVAIYMADASDSPEDLCSYFKKINEGAECVFGSRFIKGSRVVAYPKHKYLLNRFVNYLIKFLFRHGLNDTTNAFKCYRREVINGCKPFLSHHFNLTVELPLKSYIRGYKFEIIPISWENRKVGISKLKLKEMGSRYFFIILYCLLEKYMVAKDYHK
ncbi:MAG: glycosyltransferase family 2 protein [Victivallales bacterium]